MALHHQRVLLLSDITHTIDRIFELCELCDHQSLRLVVCRDTEEADQQLEHYDVSLIIFDLASVGSSLSMDHMAQRLNPKPLIALVSEGTAENLVAALRSGADDVYVTGELDLHPEQFVRSVDRQLKRAQYIEEVYSLRDTLERSLDELREDQHAAQQVQQNMLPPQKQLINGIQYEYVLRPSLLLSGDFVDAFAFDILSPSATLHRINREMLLTSLGKHLTMFVGLIDHTTQTLSYAVGGHHPLPVLLQDGQARPLEGRGMPLGLFEEPVFDELQCMLSDTFTLTLFSDGVLEVMDGESLEQKELALLSMCNAKFGSPAEFLQSMMPAGRGHPDDVAIMTVRRESV